MSAERPVPFIWSPESSPGQTHTLESRSAVPNFWYHYHKEFELVMTRGTAGRRLIGDSFSAYGNDDLALLGPNLPHTWIGDTSLADTEKLIVVVHFTRESLGLDLLSRSEMLEVNSLLDRSMRGLSFGGAQARTALELIEKLPEQEGCKRLISVLRILDELAGCEDTNNLVTEGYSGSIVERDYRMYASALKYVHDHSDRPIALSEVSDHMNMSVTSFCRFFRRVSGSSFADFVLEWRISRACALLLESSRTVLEISERVGFTNLSNFNRQFLRRRGVSPKQFRNNNPT